MKITPLELRQFEFEKTFRGYSTDEVDMLINNLAQEWERVLTETKMMRMQLELAEKEAAKLREIEMTLFKTLKTAEDTSTMITEQANQQAAKNLSEANQKAEKYIADAEAKAEKKMAEAEFEADRLLNDANLESEKILLAARNSASEIIGKAEEKAKYVNEEVLNDVKIIERDFNTLQLYKDNLLTEMRGLANATIAHVERFEDRFDVNSIQNKIKKANEIVLLDVNEASAVNGPEETTSASPVKEVFEDTLHENNDEIAFKENKPAPSSEDEDEMPADDERLVENYEEPTSTPAEETVEDVAARIDELAETLQEELVETYVDEVDVEEGFAQSADDDVIETGTDIDIKSFAAIKEKIRETSEPEKVTEETATAVPDKENEALMPSSANKYAETPDKTETASGDDLTRVEGIGPKTQEVLRAVGIVTFRDLATTPLYRIREYLSNAGANFSLVDSSTWTEQALLAAEGRWDELETRQAELTGGRDLEADKRAPVITERSPEAMSSGSVIKNKPVSNLDDITDEMLEKVNKVKSAIRKAMTEKSDKPNGEKDDNNLPTLDDVMKRKRAKGGSFFDSFD